MTRYLYARHPDGSPVSPDIATKIRTNPRVKAILWSAGAAIVGLVILAVIISHVF